MATTSQMRTPPIKAKAQKVEIARNVLFERLRELRAYAFILFFASAEYAAKEMRKVLAALRDGNDKINQSKRFKDFCNVSYSMAIFAASWIIFDCEFPPSSSGNSSGNTTNKEAKTIKIVNNTFGRTTNRIVK